MSIKKEISTLRVIANQRLGGGNYLLRLQAQGKSKLPPMQAGQFVQVKTPGNTTLLRRPISICNVLDDELWLLVARVGRGTVAITDAQEGEELDLILPLGNSFPTHSSLRPLLVGGGVGIAPMLMLAKTFVAQGIRPSILLGGRSAEYIVLRESFEELGEVYYTTDDASLGTHGRVTDHHYIQEGAWDAVYCCGPMPMMRAVAHLAEGKQRPCWVSLENTMACGIGACLCCVQDTVNGGNICVCTEGPVFDSKEIKW